MKIKFILIAVAVILCTSLALSACVPKLDVSTSTSKTTNSENSQTTESAKDTEATTVKPAETDQWGNIFAKEGAAGYKKIDNITYFYVAYDFPSVYDNLQYSFNAYGSYEVIPRYSYNLTSWNLIVDDVDEGVSTLGRPSAPGMIYISYCSISNCSDPDSVLLDLKNNVFSNSAYYSVLLTEASG